MILHRYPATLKSKKGIIEVKLPSGAKVRDFINQGTLGIFAWAETAGGPVSQFASVFLALQDGGNTEGLPFVCTISKGGYWHIYGPA